MKSYFIKQYQKAPAILGDMPEPVMNDDDVLVEVCAAGLNHLDLRIKSGEFKMLVPYSFPLILGHDVAGKVVAVGKNVRQFAVGDEVFARPRDGRIGAFAEKIAIHQDDAAKKPNNLSMADAAGLPNVFLQLAMYFLSRGVRCASCRKKVDYQFLFMQANGKQLAQIAQLVEQGHIKPYTQSVYPFEEINQAFDELEQGRTRGKIVVTMR